MRGLKKYGATIILTILAIILLSTVFLMPEESFGHGPLPLPHFLIFFPALFISTTIIYEGGLLFPIFALLQFAVPGLLIDLFRLKYQIIRRPD